MLTVEGRRVGVEIKRTDRPHITPSMRQALRDLDLDAVIVVHAGVHTFRLDRQMVALPAVQALDGEAGLVDTLGL